MRLKDEYKPILLITAAFFAALYLPVTSPRFMGALLESLSLLRWYAREHVVLCLIPAFYIAGAITIFFSQNGVMKYLGAGANRVIAYGVASVSGTLLAVCSCTVLPLFAGIYRLGAGIGPATAFLYSGPAINALAIILTARVLGVGLGVARTIGAVLFSVVIGLVMELVFGDEEAKRKRPTELRGSEGHGALKSVALLVGTMMALLIFANWANPGDKSGFFAAIYAYKWYLTAAAAALFGFTARHLLKLSWWKLGLAALPPALLALLLPSHPIVSFGVGTVTLALLLQNREDEAEEWLDASWGFARQIFPLLFAGILVAGFLLGSAHGGGIVPTSWIAGLVGGNSIFANFFASITGAFMYFATLTEVPILEGLMNNGMGKGPALALLLAGPALSLPNMLVIKSVMGWKRTALFITLVVALSTVTGFIYGLTPW